MAAPRRAVPYRAGPGAPVRGTPRNRPGVPGASLGSLSSRWSPAAPRGSGTGGRPAVVAGGAGRRPAALRAPLRGNCAALRGVWGLLQVSGGAQVVPGVRGSPDQSRGQVDGGGLTGGAFRPAGKSMVSEQEDEVQAAKVGGGRFRLTTEEKRDSSH